MQAAGAEVFAADGLQPLARLGAVPAGFGVAAQIAEHGAGLHRGQLVLVAQQHQAGVGRQGVEQVGHHFQVDHRRFIHHQHIQRQRVAQVVTEMAGARAAAQQAVYGGDLGRDFFLHVFRHFQRQHLLADGLGEARGGLAGGRGQADAQRDAGFHGGRLQQREQAHYGGGLAGAGAAGDDAEGTASGQGAGEFLPVDHAVGRRLVEQAVEALRQIGGDGFPGREAQSQGRVDTPFVGPVAAQVQALARQHQGAALGRLTAIHRQRDQVAGSQGLAPMRTVEAIEQLRRQQHGAGLQVAFGGQ